MPRGTLGIGHTRWATHGKPTYVNAHPHTDCHNRIFVVHNGIIENFAELKAELEAAGHEFTSDTDTEVVPHLIEANYKGDFLSAVRAALRRIRGAYALAMFSTDDPELLVGARLNAPLVVGLGDNEYYIASDITAIIPYTKRVLVLGEGEVAAVTPLGAEVSTLDGVSVEPKLIHVDWDISQAQKGGYSHFMLKEINESSEAVANAMRGRLTDDGIVSFREFDIPDDDLRRYNEVLLLGMGTSLHAAMIGEYVIEDWAGIPAKAMDASEFQLPPADFRKGHARGGDHPVRRNRRHAGGSPPGQGARRVDGGRHQCGGELQPLAMPMGPSISTQVRRSGLRRPRPCSRTSSVSTCSACAWLRSMGACRSSAAASLSLHFARFRTRCSRSSTARRR